jgi:hypothetical protein
MKLAPRWRLALPPSIVGALLATGNQVKADGPTVSLQFEYLMTIRATVEMPRPTGDNLRIVNVSGGSADGPKIKGKLLAPVGDWIRIMPGGIGRMDVRAAIETDDGQVVYFSYNGVQQCKKEGADKAARGELVTSDDCSFISAPTFETKSERYSWLNGVQAIGKMVELKRGDHIIYEIFSVK